jgi:signal transduction histidine kinase
VKLARPAPLLFALSAFASVAVAVTGSLLLWRYREATLAAAAEREAVLLSARAHALSDEIAALVAEVNRLSHLAEVDLADGNMEPEKLVLRLARRDSGVFSVAIAILGASGDVLWAEPREARPSGSGAELIRLVGSNPGPVVRYGEWEIDVASAVKGRGAMVAVVDGRRGRDLFGPELRRALGEEGAVLLVAPAAERDIVVASASAGAPPELSLPAPGQGWVRGHDGARWLVTEQPVPGAGLVLRQVLSAASLEGVLSGPFRRLVGLVAGLTALAVGGGLALARVTRRLERLDLQLARANELAAMGRTSAAVAHEVKNALNGLSVALDLLAAGRAPPEARDAVRTRARAEIDRLRRVAEDLTLFAAEPRLAASAVDAGRLLGQAAQAVSEQAQDARVEVELRTPDPPIVIRGDEAKLLSALINLARNGIEAMGPGAFGEPLGSAPPTRSRRLDLSAARDGERVIFSVADEGSGIPAEVRAQLFEPFVTTKRTGTGLGLAIVRKIVDAHGGEVSASDRPGGGTVFRLSLPPSREAA